MARSPKISALKVDDQAFLVSSTIERCPKVMMIRELTKNAVEAAELAPEGDRRVEFSVTNVGFAAPKLTIWNTGPGLDDEELARMTNLAASIGKEKSLDKNFGMGAKVASLPSNRLGLRYRSCRDGVVHDVILCEVDGIYGRLNRKDTNGSDMGDVVNVTEEVRAEAIRPLDRDWTEVVLCGNRPDQNTALDPYDGDPIQQRFWLANYLYHRFYRLPEGLEVRLEEGTHSRGPNSRKFETIPTRIERKFFTRDETVILPSGIIIHYVYEDKLEGSTHNKSISGAIASAKSIGAIVFRDELYALLTGRDWTIQAPTFGIPFGAKQISVHVELPGDFRVRPEGYRQFLRYIDGEQEQVELNNFALQVLENRPEWLKDIIHSLAPTSGDSNEEIRNKLQELLNKLRVQTSKPNINIDGDTQVARGDGDGMSHTSSSSASGERTSNPRQHVDLSVVHSGTQLARMAQNLQRAPQLIPLDDEADIEEKQIKRACGAVLRENRRAFY